MDTKTVIINRDGGKVCPHPHSRWFRHGNVVSRRCLDCDAILARDSVVADFPTNLSLANQMDPAELAAFMSEYQFRK